MARTTFESYVRSRGGRREDDGVSTGGMLMSVLVSTKAGANVPLKIGGDPDSGENVVLPKGSVIVSFQRLSAVDAGRSIQIGNADTAIGYFTVVNLAIGLGTAGIAVGPNGALVQTAGYLANGLPEDTQIFTNNGVTPPTGDVVGILTYFVYDDGTPGTR